MKKTGKPKLGIVYLVGAGPGNPELITLRGAEVLRQADVVLIDYLANPQLLKHVPPQSEIIFAGKRYRGPRMKQSEVHALMLKNARLGKKIVRLKGGDPFIFGRGGEEALFLAENKIPFEVIPGVSAANGVGAYAGIPLTHRGLSTDVAFVTGHEAQLESAVNWKALSGMGTVVMYMAQTGLRENLEALMKAGKSPETPAAFISNGTYPFQRIIRASLKDLAKIVSKTKNLQPPSMVIIGEVAGLSSKLKWFSLSPKPTVLVTRSEGHASQLSSLLNASGFDVVELPLISIAPSQNDKPLVAAIKKLKLFDWIVFSSVNAVDSFLERLTKSGGDLRSLATCRIAAVGEVTADFLKGKGLLPDLVPPSYHSEALVESLKKGIKGKRILIPQAREGGAELESGLKKAGALVSRVEAYRILPRKWRKEELVSILGGRHIDWIVFASSKTVESFRKGVLPAVPESLKSAKIACIGPKTKQAAVKLGFKVDFVPSRATLKDLVEGLK